MRPSLLLGVAALAALPTPASAQQGGPRVLLIGVRVDDSIGNNDGWLQPGEAARLQIELSNEGGSAAPNISGTLSYLGAASDVAITVPTAQWPTLPPGEEPELNQPPHFQILVGNDPPCGSMLPFRLHVTGGGGLSDDLDFRLRLGRRMDVDALEDAPLRIDEPEATLQGAAPGDDLGRSAAAGDVNGDGYADLLLGAPLADAPGGDRPQAGAVFLIYGGPARSSGADLSVPSPAIARFTAGDSLDELGAAVAIADINNDGYADMILGAPLGDGSGNGRENSGEVYLVYGKAPAWSSADLSSPPAGVVRIWGADPEDRLGVAVAAGDVNHDGFEDLILGAPDAASMGNTRAGAGEIYLVYGQAAALTDIDLGSPPAGVARFSGADPGDHTGASLAADDLNGDAAFEIVAGAPGAFSIGNARSTAGEVVVIDGKASAWSDTDLASPPAGVARLSGASIGDRLGEAVGTADLDGDGLRDLLLGAPGTDVAESTRLDAGVAYVVYGKPGGWADTDLGTLPAGVVRILGASRMDALGSSVAGADLDGDGYDDLILGAPGADTPAGARSAAGEVYVLHGGSIRMTDADVAMPPGGVARFHGSAPSDAIGTAVAAGDIDGDGAADLVLTSPPADAAGSTRGGAGQARIWYGKPSAGYLARPQSMGFIDASAGTQLALSCDDCSVPVAIGFPFIFYGETYTSVNVSSNGFVSFAPIDAAASAAPACLPSQGLVRSVVAPLWDDLNPAAGAAGSGVYALVQGTAPSRRLTIEWKAVPHQPATGNATFEVTLFESGSRILFQYDDTGFGSVPFDDAASAVIGVGNRSGVLGTPFSCFQPGAVTNGSALMWTPSIPIAETGSEHGATPWSTGGTPPADLWHLTTGACAPSRHTGTRSWYYGSDSTCTYATGSSGAGLLNAPSLPALPSDATIAFWYRRESESLRTGFDLSKVQLSTSGPAGPWTDLVSLTDSSGTWKYSGPLALGAPGGSTADVRFSFDTVDAIDNAHLGWMIDDVQVAGCNAPANGTARAAAVAYAQPAQACQGSSVLLDSAGSSCVPAGSPTAFQWKDGGIDVPGATGASYATGSLAPGSHPFTVAVTCPGAPVGESAPVTVSVESAPPNVGGTLGLTYANGFASLRFTWEDVAGATDYVVLESPVKNGAFTTATGTAASGTTGLTIPTPAPGVPDSITYYLVGARNAACGVGPIH